MKMFLSLCLVVCLTSSACAQVNLVKSDFKVAGDGLLVTDTRTGNQWLKPIYTRGISYNEVRAGWDGLVHEADFEIATAEEVRELITFYFYDNPLNYPGDARGFASAQDFFGVLGTNYTGNCQGFPCPRTLGWTLNDDRSIVSH